jgi:hypothetical protein
VLLSQRKVTPHEPRRPIGTTGFWLAVISLHPK